MKNYILAIALTLVQFTAHAQIINTIAGTGIIGFLGDGGAATAARFNNPHGISTDGAGNIFVADNMNNRIREVKTSATILTVTGTGTGPYSGDGGSAISSNINQPFDVYADGDGSFFIADTWNERIRKVDGAGVITTVAGSGTTGFSGDGGAATAAALNKPSGLAVDGFGNLYFADQNNHRVRKVNFATGIITTVAGTGVGAYSGDGGPATAAKLYYPNFIYVDISGNVFITDNGNHRIRKVNTSGIITTFAGTGSAGFGGDGGLATAANLYYPAGMTMDASGNAYIADHSNHRIRKVTSSGIISTIAGTGVAAFGGDGGPATAAQLNKPTDVAIDPATGALIICDYLNQRIRKIQVNTSPVFGGGASVGLSGCAAAVQVIDTLMAVSDINVGETETWSVIDFPLHGTLSGLPATAVSTGASVMPSGTSYTGATGYSGTDSFRVKVSDGTASDTLKIYVSSTLLPVVGPISGADSVCPASLISLTASTSGGVWSSTNTSIAVVSATGGVTGVAPGASTIKYTVTNSCGAVEVIHPIIVKPYSLCTSTTSAPQRSESIFVVVPNPTSGRFLVTVMGVRVPVLCTITDMLGKVVSTFSIDDAKPHEVMIDVPNGVYVLSAFADGKQWIKQLLIAR